MALDYDGIGTGFLFHVGQCIRNSNLLQNNIADLQSDLQELLDSFGAGDHEDESEGAIGDYGGAKDTLVSLRGSLASIATLRLQDRDTVTSELDLSDTSARSIVAALISRMNDDAKTVQRCVASVGSVTADSGNTGNGTILATLVLDGVNAPFDGAQSHLEYNGVTSEFPVNETITLVCESDSYSDGLTSGQESFSVRGEQQNSDQWSIESEGSGNGTTFSTLNANVGQTIQNADFENFTVANTPDSWTLTGTAGTHIFQETGGSNVYRGSSSLKFLGTGAQATISVTQAMTVSQLTPRQRYCFTIRYKASAVDTSGQTLTIQFTGTGYTASSSEKITVAGNAFDTSWTLKTFYINLPANIPSDFTLSIAVTGTLNNTKALYFDSIGFAPVVYHGGIGFAAVAGSTPFVKGDKFTFAVTNDRAGLIQDFFRRAYGAQLPSSATPNISDNLAQ